jgi:hypothetical protein
VACGGVCEHTALTGSSVLIGVRARAGVCVHVCVRACPLKHL